MALKCGSFEDIVHCNCVSVMLKDNKLARRIRWERQKAFLYRLE
jgi:hypothetical protein